MSLLKIPRKNPHLNDLIEYLHEPLLRTGGKDIDAAWDSLTPTELSAIQHEIKMCVLDRRYYLENYHVIKPENGVMKTFYPFWDHQEIVYEAIITEWNKNGTARVIVLKPRQAGLSEFSVAVVFHSTIFTPNAFTMSIAQNPETAEQLFRKAQFSYDNLPWWLRPEMQYRDRGEYMEFQRVKEEDRLIRPGLASAIQMTHAGKSTGVAIGRTVRFIHMSEVSRWINTDVMTTDIEPSMNAPDTLAIMESTALGREGLYYEMWNEAMDGEGEWKPVFIPAYRVKKYVLPLKSPIILNEEEQSLKLHALQNEGVDIPDSFFNWRRKRVQSAIRRTGGPYTHYESYPATWEESFQNSGVCAFPRPCLDEQQKINCRPPLEIGEISLLDDRDLTSYDLQMMKDSDPVYLAWKLKHMPKPKHENRLMIWEHPIGGELYYIGCDTSPGDGKDYSCAQVLKIGVGANPDEQVAEWHGYINPARMARVLAALGTYYNEAEIAVEYVGSGISTGDDLFKTLDYPNIYRWKHQDRIGSSLTPHVHWLTNSKTRDDMITRMNLALMDRTIILRSKYTVEEMRDFGRIDSGYKQEALSGNDDEVMAICIAMAAMRESHAHLKTNYDGDSTPKSNSPRQKVFGVFDMFSRQITQVNSESEGLAYISAAEAKYKIKLLGWRVLPILTMKANTTWSPIFDGQGAEHELYSQFGVAPRDIRPDLVDAYRDVLNVERLEGE